MAEHNTSYHFDQNLRDVPDDPEGMARAVEALRAASRAEVKDSGARARLLGQLGPYLRMLGHLDEAAAVLAGAVQLCDTGGDVRRGVANRLRLANVYQWQRRFDLSDPLFAEALRRCETADAARALLSFAWQHLGKSLFDQGRYAEAAAHFARALGARRADGNPELIASSSLALGTAERRLREAGRKPDDALHLFLARLLATSIGQLRSVYLEGSQVDGSALRTSDTDVTIVVADDSPREERDAVAAIARAVAAECSTELDAEITDEATLARGVPPMLKEASRLLWGEPVAERLPPMSIDAWTRDRMHSSYWRVANLFGWGGRLVLPLDYPDPRDELYGYCRRALRLTDGNEVPSTRDLVRHVGWIATSLIAHWASRHVARKRDCHRLYRDLIGDEWSDLVVAIYDRCRGAWSYLVPDSPGERAELRAICARTLAFERHFLAVYHDYVLRELRSQDGAAWEMAADILRRVPFPDAEVSQPLSEAPEVTT
jgi:predicted nucleotidyltransferase